MTEIVIFKKKKLDYTVGFETLGHAGYAKRGEDIICSATSVLVINTINSIEKYSSSLLKDRHIQLSLPVP